MTTIVVTKRYHQPSTSSQTIHSRVMDIRLPAPPFEIPPDTVERSRAARCAVTEVRMTKRGRRAILFAALAEVAAESDPLIEDRA